MAMARRARRAHYAHRAQAAGGSRTALRATATRTPGRCSKLTVVAFREDKDYRDTSIAEDLKRGGKRLQVRSRCVCGAMRAWCASLCWSALCARVLC
jgi:hypothetical protein